MIQRKTIAIIVSIFIYTFNVQASYRDETLQEIKENFKKGCLRKDKYIMMEALYDLQALKMSKKACRMLSFDVNDSTPSRKSRRIVNYDELTEMQDKDGNTPLYNAVRDNRIDAVIILLQFGANPKNALINHLYPVDREIEDMLIDAGAELPVAKKRVTRNKKKK